MSHAQGLDSCGVNTWTGVHEMLQAAVVLCMSQCQECWWERLMDLLLGPGPWCCSTFMRDRLLGQLSRSLEQLEMVCVTETHSQESSASASARAGRRHPIVSRQSPPVYHHQPAPTETPAAFLFPMGPRAQVPVETRVLGPSWGAGLAARIAFSLAAAGLILVARAGVLPGWCFGGGV